MCNTVEKLEPCVLLVRDTGIPMFTAAFFTIAKTLEQPKCHEWMNV